MRLTDLAVSSAGQRCSFVLHGARDAATNALRRTMLCDIPTMRLSSVAFETNTTIFPDDMIAHRLGLMPPVANGDPVDACVTFSLDRRGTCTLLSDDMCCSDAAVRLRPGLLLCRLEQDQQLALTTRCTMGDGRQHARFQACVAPRYAKMHVGSGLASECWFESTGPGHACKACGRSKPSAAGCAGAVVHRFAFETDSSAEPLWLLAQTLTVLERRLVELLAAVDPAPRPAALDADPPRSA